MQKWRDAVRMRVVVMVMAIMVALSGTAGGPLELLSPNAAGTICACGAVYDDGVLLDDWVFANVTLDTTGLYISQVSAQEKPVAAPTAPTVPDDLKRTATDLQVIVKGFSLAIAALSKELDAATMQFQRAIQQAQAACAATPGYTLAPTLACVKEPEVKKEPEKKNDVP